METAEQFRNGKTDGVSIVEGRLRLDPGRTEGTFTSALLPAERPFDRACPSWNATTPEGTSISVALAVRLKGQKELSAWLPFGTWRGGDGDARARSGRHEDKGARVAVDTLIASGDADAVRYRLTLRRADAAAPSPTVRRVAIARWKKGERAPFAATPSPAWGVELDVPHRAQGWEDPEIAGRICSPTSLAMVMEFHGKKLPTAEVCRRVHDEGAEIYGNWSFNAAAAGELGFAARVDRFASLRELEREIENGRPVIISHQWKEGELTGAPVELSDGHLIVVVGFTETGDVIANDPAANPRKGGGPGRRVYSRREIYRTWLENAAGIVYLVRPE